MRLFFIYTRGDIQSFIGFLKECHETLSFISDGKKSHLHSTIRGVAASVPISKKRITARHFRLQYSFVCKTDSVKKKTFITVLCIFNVYALHFI